MVFGPDIEFFAGLQHVSYIIVKMMIIPLLFFAHSVLQVGPGRIYESITKAVEVAQPGDVIAVYPSLNSYPGTQVSINKANLTIEGMGPRPIRIVGDNFNYDGVGSTPRAVFQLNSSGNGFTLKNFDISGAHNDSFNGAGVRINAANNVTITHCLIHGNDMGIMSNGLVKNEHAGENQVIDHCTIFSNGTNKEPGQNHNLYLGGTSVTMQYCNVYGSTTGHNFKSRAHFNLIKYCQIHDASNRELDLVEAWDTERPNSNTVLIGNIIIKDPNCQGNRGVIHFGAEKGTHVGTLYLFNNIITTYFSTPLIMLDSTKTNCVVDGNILTSTAPGNHYLFDLEQSADISQVSGSNNWASSEINLPKQVGTNQRSEVTTNSSIRDEMNPPILPNQSDEYADGNGVKHKVNFDISQRPTHTVTDLTAR